MNKNLLLKYITTRKCAECKEIIILENYLFEPDIEIMSLENKSYHKSCLKEFLSKKKKYKDLDFDVFWSENIDKSNAHFWSIVTRNHLYKYLAEFFNVTMFTSSFYQKMEQVFTGKWKDVNKEVLPEHLLDMYQRRKQTIINIMNRKKITGMNALNYSIPVVLNMYEDYLNWLAKCEQEKIEIQKEKSEKQIEYARFTSQAKKEIKSIFEE